MITVNIVGLLAAMTVSLGSTGSEPITLVCTVSGSEALTPPMTVDQVCRVIATQMKDGLKRDVRVDASDQPVEDAGLVRVDVNFETRRGIVAVVETSSDDKRLKSPELSVSAMDREINSSDIEQLGRDIAQYVGNK